MKKKNIPANQTDAVYVKSMIIANNTFVALFCTNFSFKVAIATKKTSYFIYLANSECFLKDLVHHSDSHEAIGKELTLSLMMQYMLNHIIIIVDDALVECMQ